MLDIRANISLVVDSEGYDIASDRVKYNGKVYAIYRYYPMSNGFTQIYCGEKAGVS